MNRTALLPALAVGLTTTSQGALELAYPLRQRELGDPLTLVGVAFGLLSVGSLLSVTTSEAILGGAFVLFGPMRALLRVTSATAVADERQRLGGSVGMASAVYNAGLDAGAILGPPAAGALAGAFDIPTSFRVVALGLPVVYYVIWLLHHHHQPHRCPEQTPLETGLST